jgi:hypothetical protein
MADRRVTIDSQAPTLGGEFTTDRTAIAQLPVPLGRGEAAGPGDHQRQGTDRVHGDEQGHEDADERAKDVKRVHAPAAYPAVGRPRTGRSSQRTAAA